VRLWTVADALEQRIEVAAVELERAPARQVEDPVGRAHPRIDRHIVQRPGAQ